MAFLITGKIDHCGGCGREDPKSNYRCGLCKRWVCRGCFYSDYKLCEACVFANQGG